jgi:two-component sensor histidine kinase
LAGEMRHRIKNSLATVQALATHTLHSISAEELETFTARLHALASAHDLLATKPRSGASLGSVVTRALEAFQQDKREHLLIEGTDDIWLDANKSLSLSMALHELATNAVKYGALSNASGRVRIDWKHHVESNRLWLVWQETGGPRSPHQGVRDSGCALSSGRSRAREAALGSTSNRRVSPAN